MNFDRNTVIGFVVLAVLFFGFFYYNSREQAANLKNKERELAIKDSIARLNKPQIDPGTRVLDSTINDSLGRVASAGGFREAATGKLVDLKTRTVTPGWMDMHVHIEHETSPTRYMETFTLNPADFAFQSVKFAETTLLTGFTTVRDLGGSGVNISLRNAINKGIIKGPRVYTAGKSIATTGGHADPTNGYRKDLMGDNSEADQ